MLRPRKITAILAGSLLGLSALALGAGTASAADGDPPGNNGTIKVDTEPFDDDPNNEPHVACIFQIDFYGYDEGDLKAEVTFELQPPTLRAGADQLLLHEADIPIGEDPAGGGTDLDASKTYTLDFTGVTPQPQQGFHVKLTINADGSIGDDTKHKVFWVEPCEETSTPTPSETPSETPSKTPSESETPGGTTPPEETTAAAGELPRTGSGFPVGTAALLAIFLMAAGGVLLLTSRGVIKLPHDGVVRLPRGVTIRLPYRQKH